MVGEHTKSGIYTITNSLTGDCYIGSSVNIEKRMTQHRNLLRNNLHHSTLLQAAWDKYGEDVFTFDVLEIVSDVGRLVAVEQRYIDERNPQYNPARIALRNVAGVASDPEKLRRQRANAQKARIVMGEQYEELAILQRMANRDDDIMKVLSVTRSLTPREIMMIEESSDLAEALYREGLVSGKQYTRGLALLMSEDHFFSWDTLIAIWVERGIMQDEIPILLSLLGISSDKGDLPPALTATELALNALASTVSRELHVTNDSQGFAKIQGDVRTAGEIVGHTRAEIERATGRPVVSPRNMIKEPDGGLWQPLSDGTDEDA